MAQKLLEYSPVPYVRYVSLSLFQYTSYQIFAEKSVLASKLKQIKRPPREKSKSSQTQIIQIMSDEMLNNKESILFMISREPHTLFLVEQLAHFTDYLFDGNTYSRIDFNLTHAMTMLVTEFLCW